jgi:hypothetical protein
VRVFSTACDSAAITSIVSKRWPFSFIFNRGNREKSQWPTQASRVGGLYSPFVGPWSLFQFLNLYTVGTTPWTGDQPVAMPLPTHRTTETQNKRSQTSVPLVGFEPTIPVFERAKTVHDLDRAATLIGSCVNYTAKNKLLLGLYGNKIWFMDSTTACIISVMLLTQSYLKVYHAVRFLEHGSGYSASPYSSSRLIGQNPPHYLQFETRMR